MNRSVLLVVSSLSSGGAERVVSGLASGWAKKGWPVGLLTLSASDSDHYFLDTRVQRIAIDGGNAGAPFLLRVIDNFKRILEIRRAVRDFSPEIVVSFIDQTNVRVLAATLGLGIPIVVSERIDPRQYRIGLPWRLARQLFYKRAAAVIVQTESVAGWAKKIVPSRKVKVIPNAVRQLPPPDRTGEARFVLAVGRLVEQKGFDMLISAFAKCRAQSRGFELVILGEGPQRSGLESLARTLGMGGAIRFPGVVTSPEEWMRRCTVFVLSSRYEGFPNVLLEAMAMGCAVIATDCPSGPADIVRQNVDGILVPNEDIDALTAALDWLLGNQRARHELGRQAMAVRERFDFEKISKTWELLIDDLVRDRPRKKLR